jgi:hypothetical protein
MPISELPSPSMNCDPGSVASAASSDGSSHGLIRPAGRSPSRTSLRMWPWCAESPVLNHEWTFAAPFSGGAPVASSTNVRGNDATMVGWNASITGSTPGRRQSDITTTGRPSSVAVRK